MINKLSQLNNDVKNNGKFVVSKSSEMLFHSVYFQYFPYLSIQSDVFRFVYAISSFDVMEYRYGFV